MSKLGFLFVKNLSQHLYISQNKRQKSDFSGRGRVEQKVILQYEGRRVGMEKRYFVWQGGFRDPRKNIFPLKRGVSLLFHYFEPISSLFSLYSNKSEREVKNNFVVVVMLWMRGYGKEVIFPDKGGRLSKVKSDFAWRGGEGASRPPIKKMKSFVNSP